MLDFENIMKDRGLWDDNHWHATKHTYTFPTGSKIEFFSVDTYGKAHGPRRDILFMNECNNMPFNIADQLITRTRKFVWLDWNPTNEFWFYTELQPFRDDIDFITLTYLDNEALDQTTVDEIESHRHNSNWWRVYGEGLLGDVESRVYTGWAELDTIPETAELVSRGLDFGYSNDPTAIIDIYDLDGTFIFDELLYIKGWSNKSIADFLLSLESTTVMADSAEPKSIDEISLYGVDIHAAQKGPGSVNQGIQFIQDQTIFFTKRSVNLIKEYRNYLWQTDKDGKIINKPEDVNNHLLDALRYGLESYVYSSQPAGIITQRQPIVMSSPGYSSKDGHSQEPVLDIRSILENKDQRDWRDI